MYLKKFRFGIHSEKYDGITVTADDLYQPSAGYGFVVEQNRRKQELLKIPEINAGFDTVYWYRNEELTQIRNDDQGCFMEAPAAGIPLIFKADVPRQGNYRVTVTVQAPAGGMENMLLFSGRRRLAYKGSLAAGESFTGTFLTNVCDIIPRGKECIYEDKSIDVAIIADALRITRMQIEEVNCPTLYIAGDSTLTDQNTDYPYFPEASYAGWGQMLGAFLDNDIVVSNHAHSGLTTESFRKEGHYAIVRQYCKPGDFLLIQFGHNDQKLDSLKAAEGYRENLLRYINECRDNRMHPLMVTPVARNSWRGNDGSYNDLLKEYADCCLALGREMDVPVIDLHQRSMEFVTALGLEAAKRFYYPGDFTHSNDYGAYQMARFVTEEILRVCRNHPVNAYAWLADHVTEGFGEWTPPLVIKLPEKPEAYAEMVDPDAAQDLFVDLERRSAALTRAEALDMIIQTARFFRSNVYNDMFVDVVGHEWYAGGVECAYQNGIIPPELCSNNRFYPEQEVKLWEFLVLALNGYKSRKQLPAEEPCQYDGSVPAYGQVFIRAACSLGLLPKGEKVNLNRIISRGEAADICKNFKI